jgi:hypothetical protein
MTSDDLAPSGRDGDDRTADAVMAELVRTLRVTPAVRPAWRAELLDAVAHEAPPERASSRASSRAARAPRRPLVLQPTAAIAASLTFMLLGAGATVLATRVAHDAPLASDRVGPTAIALPTDPPAPRALVQVRSETAGAPDPAGDVVRFMIVAPRAADVAVVGDFNRWDPERTRLRPLADGRTWIADVPMQPGRHAYAFVIDGAVTGDPTAPRAGDDDFGQPNSVVVVPPRS